MKKYFYKYTLIIVLAVLVFSSCRKLEEEVFSSVFTNNFYQTSQDAEAALTAAYGALSYLYWGPTAVLASDFSADQSYPRPVVGRNTLTLFSYDVDYSTQKSFGRAQQEGPLGIWQYSYKGIENANWVIEKVPTIKMDPTRRDAIVGEALFLRAYYHFLLTKNFRDVIIKTSPSKDESAIALSTSLQADVFKQIYKDLDDAIAKLPSYSASSPEGRPAKEVAIGLYAKAALYAGDWALAKDKATLVINSGKYTLMPDILDVFNVEKEDMARTENMFSFESESLPNNVNSYNWMMGLCGPPGNAGKEYGNTTFGSMFAYQSFFDSFHPDDRRRKLLDTNYINRQNIVVAQKNITPITTKGVLIKKYMDKNSVGPISRNNVPILRLADIYLIAAEAEFRLNGSSPAAVELVNKVRRRAFGQAISLPSAYDLINVSLSSILQERSWELFAEGDRWYDLTRTNTFLTVIPNAVNNVFPVRSPQSKHRYFPIPQDEIRANPNIVQNPDWQ